MIKIEERQFAVELIKEAITSGARQNKACQILEISPRTYQRWTTLAEIRLDGRPIAKHTAPSNKLSTEEREAIIATMNAPEYRSLPPSQVVPSLADKGRYLASESTFYRVMRERNQQHHRGRSEMPQKKVATTYCATEPNQVWCWDITWLPGPVRGLFYYLYMIMDIYTRKIVGWEIHDRESSDMAGQLISKACLSEGMAGRPLVLHSDNGSPMKGSSMLETLYRLGVTPSYSRPRVSNDNAYAESLFRTCKYRPDYPYKGFADIDKAREWVNSFVHWYNMEHKHSSLKFTTPQQRHSGQSQQILEQRVEVYKQARERHPNRWSGEIRNWDLPSEVWLNPEKTLDDSKQVA